MTPPPAAAAAPAVRPRRSGRSASRAPVPRRVSGPGGRKPAGPKASAGTAARVAPRGGAVALPAPGPMALGLIDAFAGISRHRWLDRLIHGRAWIALVAFALIGIVAMQLWVVKLGVGIGRALEHEGLLQRENATLSIEDAQLSSGERVEQLAAARGMVVATPGSLRFDASRGALDARLAAAALAKAGQIDGSGSSGGGTATSTTSSGTEATASSTEAAAPSSGTATAAGSTTSTEAAESSTAAGATSTTTASPPEGASDSEAPATATPATPVEGAAADPATGAAAAGGGAAVSEPAAAGAAAVGSDGGTQQQAPGG